MVDSHNVKPVKDLSIKAGEKLKIVMGSSGQQRSKQQIVCSDSVPSPAMECKKGAVLMLPPPPPGAVVKPGSHLKHLGFKNQEVVLQSIDNSGDDWDEFQSSS